MRTVTTLFAILALALLAGCGGSRPAQSGATIEEVHGPTVRADQPDTDIAADDTERVDEGVGVGEEGVRERQLSEMTLEEINAAGFLSNIYFDFDKSELREDSVEQLLTNGQWLRQNPNVQVLLEGHCDERGTEEYNIGLGERRAITALNFLTNLGIERRRFTIVSYGESRPADPRHNEAAWSLNRRVHFLVTQR